MAAKNKTENVTTTETLKFTKGEFYQDLQGNLWCCHNGRARKSGDDLVVSMCQASGGEPTGDPSDESITTFVKQLTAAEVEEYREICQRERDAEAETEALKQAEAIGTTTEPVATVAKTKKSKPASDAPKKMSALDAAAKVLEEASEPMGTKEMIEAMSLKGYWTSPGGQTPHATLYSAILREINVKGTDSRFAKTDRGRFARNVSGVAVALAAPEVAAETTEPAATEPAKVAIEQEFSQV